MTTWNLKEDKFNQIIPAIKGLSCSNFAWIEQTKLAAVSSYAYSPDELMTKLTIGIINTTNGSVVRAVWAKNIKSFMYNKLLDRLVGVSIHGFI